MCSTAGGARSARREAPRVTLRLVGLVHCDGAVAVGLGPPRASLCGKPPTQVKCCQVLVETLAPSRSKRGLLRIAQFVVGQLTSQHPVYVTLGKAGRSLKLPPKTRPMCELLRGTLRFPPDRRGIDNEDRDAREAEEVRPGVP